LKREQGGAGQFGSQRDFARALPDRTAVPHHKRSLPHDDFRRAHHDHWIWNDDFRAPFISRIPAIMFGPAVRGHDAPGSGEEGDNAAKKEDFVHIQFELLS
jgi:hypothetical protein